MASPRKLRRRGRGNHEEKEDPSPAQHGCTAQEAGISELDYVQRDVDKLMESVVKVFCVHSGCFRAHTTSHQTENSIEKLLHMA
jgi:hypothetical protein